MDDQAMNQYKIDAINTLSDDQLGLMLFEAALRHARQCQEAIREQNWTLTVQHGRFVQDVMANLADAINKDNPASDVMRQLYLYCWRQSIRAQMEHHVEDLDPVINVLANFIQGLKGHVAQQAAMAPVPTESINFAG